MCHQTWFLESECRVFAGIGKRIEHHRHPKEIPGIGLSRQPDRRLFECSRRYTIRTKAHDSQRNGDDGALAVIVAVTDGARRRYFTTGDGARLVEVDEASFERRSEGGARSLLELDERELAELEAESGVATGYARCWRSAMLRARTRW